MQPTRANYDSEFCGKLPLHLINVIQPYGALLVLQPDDLQVIQVSENTEAILGLPPAALLGQLPEMWLDAASAERLRRLAALRSDTERLPERLNVIAPDSQQTVHAVVHIRPDCLLVETEPIVNSNTAPSFAGLYGDLKYTMAAVNTTDSVEDACKAALIELKRLSGFDRLMVYRFDSDWNGTVIAELMEDGMEPYLDLRFPASDIPKGARDLYLQNPYRLIPDRNYTPVKLQPILNPRTGTFTDLTPCNLRGVAKVHLEYLANMGVTASMSTRVLVDGKLWGLLSCHHRTPKHPTYEECAVFELLGGVLAARVEALQLAGDTAVSADLQRVQAALMERLFLERDLARGLLADDTNLCGLFQSEGAAVVRGRTVNSIGHVPDRVAIEELSYWLQANHSDKVSYWNKLAEVYEPATSFTDTASGLIAVPIRPEQGEFLLGFRPELVQEVSWGGNPEDAMQFESDGVNYHPRKSFDIWKRTVRGTAREWTAPEVVTAERFRNFVQEFMLRELTS